jgi:UDP-N-acetylmuramoyl-tripeptide--D-alanyl-D-alanine ligase
MPGDIFFALKGPSFNGNHYAKQAIESGAVCCVVDESLDFEDDKLFRVDDVLTALQQLARFHREQFNIPFLAITGSNGKTTTKELIHAVLSEQFITYTTTGNLNNHIGIPLTLLKIKKDAQMAVIEMGANHQLEIAGYCSYVQPTHGLITNCGMAHLEGFGGQAGIRKGKGELFDYLRAHDGTAFVLDDHDYFKDMSVGLKEIITYGTKSTANTIGHIYNDERFLQVSLLNDGIEEIMFFIELTIPNIGLSSSIELNKLSRLKSSKRGASLILSSNNLPGWYWSKTTSFELFTKHKSSVK